MKTLVWTFPVVVSALFAGTLVHAADALPLDGQWRFHRDEAKVGVTNKWYADALPQPSDGPAEIHLPGSTDEAKAGLPNPKPPTLAGLYRPNVFAGIAWYQRNIDIPETWKGRHVTLFLERNHWVTHVWLDGKDLGTQDSLVSPQVYNLGTDVAPGTHRLTISVDNTLKFDLGPFVSIISEATQTDWNGIVGAIELRADDPVALSDVEVYPDVDRKLIKVEARVSNVTGASADGSVQFSVTDGTGAAIGAPVSATFSAPGTESVVTAEVPMGDNPKLWDEFTPNLYVLKTSLTADSLGCHSEKDVSFGMRKFAAQGTQFTMNGRILFLRGTTECCIFPLTGYPPTDVASWRRIYQIEKSYGLNFIRFHSWCPPDAAFTAADQEGIMIQAEGPLADVTTVGKDHPRDDFVEQELMRMIHTYGNHPSFCLMTIGNEYGGPIDLLTHWVDMLIQGDPRHLYSSASSASPVTPNREWTESGDNLGVYGPGTEPDFHDFEARQDRPMVGHEVGQWTFYPHFDEIKKYTGVLEAKNFELVRDSLQAKGMVNEAVPFFQATGQEARLLYKQEIEIFRRTPEYAGFSLLDLHDYPGTGTALIGLLDPFWDSKGFITPEEHKRYFGATVPLLRFPKRTYATDETFLAKAELAHFGPTDLIGAQPEWTIMDEAGHTVANGSLPGISLPSGKLTELGAISAPLNRVSAPAKLTVTVSLKDTAFSNSWDIWVYPPPAEVPVPENIIVSSTWDAATRTVLAQGKKVILFPTWINPSMTLQGSFTPVYWSPVWFHFTPATMGILCEPKHPLFAQFPTEFYSDWQWWNLIEGSRTMNLNDSTTDFRPLVQVIDNFSRNDKLGNVFETRVGNGKLLVCTLNLGNGKTPETAQFLRSLYAYVSSDNFQPTSGLTSASLDLLLESPTSNLQKIGAKVLSCDSAAVGYPAAAAIDGNTNSFWNTTYGPNAAPMPHFIAIDMGKTLQLKGVTYLARQDIARARAGECEVYLSDDPAHWGEPAATAQLVDSAEVQTILFKNPASGRYLKFLVKSGISHEPYVAAAELDIIPAP